MIRVLEWLLDLEDIRLGRDAPLLLKWDAGIPQWALFGLALLAAFLIFLIYRREEGRVRRRVVLATIRLAVILTVGAMFCRPMLVLQRNRIDPSKIILLVDESRSMSRSDPALTDEEVARFQSGAAIDSADAVRRASRLDLARALIERNEMAVIRGAPDRNMIQLFSFAGSLRQVSAAVPVAESRNLIEPLRTLTPDGANSDPIGALREIFRREQNRRLTAIVLVSDGRSTTPVDSFDVLQQASSLRVPIYPVRIGSSRTAADVYIDSIHAPPSVFLNDILAVKARVGAVGAPAGTAITVRLVQVETGASLAQEVVSLEPYPTLTEVELRTRPQRVGATRYRIEIDAPPDDTETSNNTAMADVDVVDEKLRVLYVDAHPRYEYRYLKTALVRERTVQVSVLLLDADEGFIQEGADPIRRFPETPEELNHYDVVLFGDVDPRQNWLDTSQMRLLLDFVGNEGGGFGLIAGEHSAPARFAGTPLERLLPVRISPEPQPMGAMITVGFHPRLTAEGAASRLFRFVADADENRRVFDSFPELYWYARSLGPRPGATVLLEHPIDRGEQGLIPLVVTGRYGAGKLFFQATDDTWRWRRHTGEFFHDAYWIQVVRWLSPTSRPGEDRQLMLTTDRRLYALGDTVDVQVRIVNPETAVALGTTLSVRVTDSDGRPVTKIEARRTDETSSLFVARFMPSSGGSFVLHADGIGSSTDVGATASIHVAQMDLESRRPEADHELLWRLASGSGGELVEPDQLARVMSGLGDRSVQVPDDVTESLWDSRLAAGLIILLLTMEWVLRKARGMV